MNEPPLSRIVVENESDWLRVKANVEGSLSGTMEARLSSLPGGKDGRASRTVQQEVEARLAKITETMFELSKPNLRVNGHNYEDFVTATEPFDEILDRRIWGLNTEKVGWDTAIAERRKKTPADIYLLEEDLEKRKTAAEWLPEGEDDVAGPKKKAEDIPQPPRHQEVVETFNTTMSSIASLASTAPAQVARAQRAKTVQEEIANMPP